MQCGTTVIIITRNMARLPVHCKIRIISRGIFRLHYVKRLEQRQNANRCDSWKTTYRPILGMLVDKQCSDHFSGCTRHSYMISLTSNRSKIWNYKESCFRGYKMYDPAITTKYTSTTMKKTSATKHDYVLFHDFTTLATQPMTCDRPRLLKPQNAYRYGIQTTTDY
jgi:hypothetical protein